MALSLAYVNEVLGQYPSTVVVSEQVWPDLVRALRFEGRDLEKCVLGRMRLRWALGGYDGVLTKLEALTQERDALTLKVSELEQQVEALTSPAIPTHAAAIS